MLDGCWIVLNVGMMLDLYCLVGEKRKEEKKVQPLTSCGTINLSSVLDGCWIGVENVGLMLDL